ncbi:MAG: DUF2797 domain-containing protein [Pseudomonadales bacterium]
MSDGELLAGSIRKMQVRLTDPVEYQLPLGDELLSMNQYIGSHLTFNFNGNIFCIHCGRKTKKSFSQGYCFPCMKRLAQCDSCILSPEKCHYDAGTCREPEWGEQNCMIEHIVYLANASAPKVGITRGSQVPTRWIDQGASQALPILAVQTRLQSGLVEVLLKAHIADKTNWRTMLKGSPDPVDLQQLASNLLEQIQPGLTELQNTHGLQAIQILSEQESVDISYPVEQYPEKIVSLNAEKTPELGGQLLGIKGQYLIFDTGVINMRKYTGYDVSVRLAS